MTAKRWIVALSAIVAAVGGFVVASLVGVRVNDPVVQGAAVGAIAGVVGGVLGASITAWTTRQATRETVAEAKAARVASERAAKADRDSAVQARAEARQDAKDAVLLQERLAAIVAVLTEGERATGRIELLAMKVEKADSPMPEMDMEDDFHRAWLALILLAPDVIAGPGAAYRAAVANHMLAYTDWAFQRLAEVKAGQDIAPRPHGLDEADAQLDLARAAFLLAAIKHLGFRDYAHLDVDALVEGLKSRDTWPA